MLKNILFLLSFILGHLSFAQKAALNFDGIDDVVQTNYSAITGKAERTVEAWIKTTANCDPNNGGKQKVILDWGSTATGGRFTLNLLWSNAIRIELGGSGLSGKTTLNDGKWHHVAAVFNPADSNRYSLFVDGILDVAGFISTTINTTSSNNLMIGKRVDNVNYFEGEIDEVRVYDFAKSDSLIKAHMNKEFCIIPKGLIAYFTLNDGNPGGNNTSKTTAGDKSGNGNHGTLSGFTLSGSSSNWVNGVNLNGGATTSSLDIYECVSYKSPSGKYTWTFAGNYKDTLTNSNQCDSIITIKLTIGKSNSYASGNGCDSFVSPGNKVYYKTGTYIETYKSYRGCDSIISYDITINKRITENIKVEVCDFYKSDAGTIYTTSGKYMEKFTQTNGCDSIIQFDITINQPVFTYDTIETCDSAYINGIWHSNSSIIKIATTGTNKCDSVHFIALTINKSYLETSNPIACDSFLAKDGKYYTKSGQYIEALKTIKGCDSIHIYNFEVYPTTTTPLNQTTCDSGYIYGNWYYSDTIVNDTLISSHGCDSIIIFNLKATHINPLVTVNNYTLTAVGNADNYTWINCATKETIAGAKSKILIAPRAGRYAVILELNDCVDTSECYSVATGSIVNFDKNIIYPNPNNGNFTLSFENNSPIELIIIRDQLGRAVYQKAGMFHSGYQVNSQLLAGIYYVHVFTSQGVIIQKMLVE